MRNSLACQVLCSLLVGMFAFACAGIRNEKRTYRVQVETTPPGAKVWYQDATGQHMVGTSPTVLEREYDQGVHEQSPWSWVTAVLSTCVFAGSTTWAAYAPESDDTQQGISIALAVVSGLIMLGAVPVAIGGELNDGEDALPRPFDLDLGADLEGYTGARMKVTIPSGQDKLSLLLHPSGKSQPVAKESAVLGALKGGLIVAAKPPVVAVFDIHDASGRFKRADLDQLTGYLATCLTQARKGRVVPREQIRERLKGEKAGGYRACFEESCQIDLGRAVAAEKSLSTTLIRVGKKCALTINLFDLKSETAERGATVETGCGVEALMGAMKKVAEDL